VGGGGGETKEGKAGETISCSAPDLCKRGIRGSSLIQGRAKRGDLKTYRSQVNRKRKVKAGGPETLGKECVDMKTPKGRKFPEKGIARRSEKGRGFKLLILT